MPFEFKKNETPPQETEENADHDGVTRRGFLKKSGKIISGAMVLGSMAESVWSAKKRKEEIENEFSWPGLLSEIEETRKKFGEKWEQKVRERLQNGINRYFDTVAREDILAKKGPGFFSQDATPGFLEGIAAGVIYEHVKKLNSRLVPIRNLDDLNSILLFGGAGAGVELVIENLEMTNREKDPNLGLQTLKKQVEDLAFRALDLGKETRATLIKTEKYDGLADTVIQNIIDSEKFLTETVGALTRLEKWGAGTALTHLATTQILKKREEGIKAGA